MQIRSTLESLDLVFIASPVVQVAQMQRLVEVTHKVNNILQGDQLLSVSGVRLQHFQLAVNRKSAAALGLVIPQSILIRADTVIE